MSSSAEQSLITKADLKQAAALTAGWTLAAMTPHSADAQAVSLLNRWWKRSKAATARDLAVRIQETLPHRFSQEQAQELVERWYERRAEITWGRMRALHRSDWRIRLDLEGEDHIREALSHGRGVVVWFMSFCDSFLLMRALAEADLPVAHLSLQTHWAPSKSRLGLGQLARWSRIAEDRHLQERIIIRNVFDPGYFKRMGETLALNHVLTVRGEVPQEGSNYTADFLGVKTAFPGGAPALAYRRRAPLLTAYCARVDPFYYRVVVQQPVAAEGGDRREFAAAAVREFARRLEEQVDHHPLDWEGWWSIHRLAAAADPDRKGAE